NDRPHLLAKFTYRSGLGTLVVNTALGEGFRKLNSQTFGAPDYYGYVEEDSSVSEYTGAIIMQRVEGHPLSAVSFSRYQYSTIDTTCYRAISEVGIAPTAVHWDLHPMNLISSDPRLERGPFVDDARVYVIDQASRVPIQLG
ncbi:hypothetical protein KDA00_05150, partial [Candidatus Saccharibacteria bacterium]|nr:hypothetical protein [Candidatus Saccharibacteria bacterium]